MHRGIDLYIAYAVLLLAVDTRKSHAVSARGNNLRFNGRLRAINRARPEPLVRAVIAQSPQTPEQVQARHAARRLNK
jgi:hypothetical protein